MTFDIEAFQQTTVQGELDTKYVSIPEKLYTARVDRLAGRSTPDGAPIMDVFWVVDDEEAKEVTGMPEPSVRQSIFLDLDANGNLDVGKGKNVQLGRLREAVGQNTGEAWSPSQLIGQVAQIEVVHKKAGDDIFANVSKVASLG